MYVGDVRPRIHYLIFAFDGTTSETVWAAKGIKNMEEMSTTYYVL